MISVRKLDLLVEAGVLPKVKIGRCTRFDLRDIEALIASSKRGGQ
jgi:hypothetical protein